MLVHSQTINLGLYIVMVLLIMIPHTNSSIMSSNDGWEKLDKDLGVYGQFDLAIRDKFSQNFNHTLRDITEAYKYKAEYSDRLGEY